MKFKILKQSFGILLLLLMGSASVYAQKTITGKVISNENEPLIAVNVQVKNSSVGTVSDLDGSFEISASPNDTLVFSYIGFTSQEIRVGDQTVINVTLSSDANLLDEVVVIGYGSVKKSDLTGSVASLSGTQIGKIPITSAAQAITGRLPGVNVLTTDGSPDAEVVIRVRGGGSITQDNSPLFVVDGFIVNSIRDIPPSDIESISVLKDASATAIYGSGF